VWQAWHLVTSTSMLCGMRGTFWHWLSFFVAGVALFDIDLHFLWQAWRLWTSTFMLRGRRGTFGHRPWCCVAGVALGNIVLTTLFLIGGIFLVLFSLWNAPGFQSIVPVSKSHVCVVGIVLMICIILCSKEMRKWLCSKVMHQTVFQSDPATLKLCLASCPFYSWDW